MAAFDADTFDEHAFETEPVVETWAELTPAETSWTILYPSAA